MLVGVVASLSVAAVAVLGRPFLEQVVMSQQYQRKLSILAAEYRAALRNIDWRADELGTAFFESKRAYFMQQASELDQSKLATEGTLAGILQTTQKMAAMQLRTYAMRQYLISLRGIGAKQEAAKLQEDLDDQIADDNDDYIPRMRQSGFPVDDLFKYLRQNIPKTV